MGSDSLLCEYFRHDAGGIGIYAGDAPAFGASGIRTVFAGGLGGGIPQRIGYGLRKYDCPVYGEKSSGWIGAAGSGNEWIVFISVFRNRGDLRCCRSCMQISRIFSEIH